MNSKRLYSLDALRGFDMFFIMGLSGLVAALCALAPNVLTDAIALQMKHVEWDGLRHHDTIFPLFLFLAGVSFPFSLAKSQEAGASKLQIYVKVIRRGVMLILLGLVYNGLFRLEFDTLRCASVLGRIGLAWMAAALLYVSCGVKVRATISVAILVGYALLSKYVACAGLSLGEYGALYAGGAFSFADGLKLLAKRAELMDVACKNTNGGMASVLGGDAAIIKEVCAACDIDVANFNSPGQIVISGEKSKLENAVAMLKEKGMKKVIVLNVAGAFHSRLMAEAGEGLKAVLADSQLTMPQLPVLHNFTADVATNEADLKDNLAKQVAGSVQWEGCVRNIVNNFGGELMIEFGPGNVLTGLLRRTLPEVKYANINSSEAIENFAL